MVALLLVYILEEEMERLSFASQPRANLPRQPSSEDRESPVPPPPPPLGQGPAGPGPWGSFPPRVLTPGCVLSIALEALTMTRVLERVQVAPHLWNRTRVIHFPRMFSPNHPPHHLSNPGLLAQPPGNLSGLSLHLWSLPGASPSGSPFHAAPMCFFSYLSPALGCDSLRSRLCFILFRRTHHTVRELVTSKYSTYNY